MPIRVAIYDYFSILFINVQVPWSTYCLLTSYGEVKSSISLLSPGVDANDIISILFSVCSRHGPYTRFTPRQRLDNDQIRSVHVRR